MLLPSMSSPATFCDVALSAVFDSNSASSSVSLDWIVNSGLHTQNSQAAGLLALPCDAGVIFMCINLRVTASLPYDLVLGLDWFHFICESTSGIVVHLSSGPLDLRCPLPTIGTESVLSTGAL